MIDESQSLRDQLRRTIFCSQNGFTTPSAFYRAIAHIMNLIEASSHPPHLDDLCEVVKLTMSMLDYTRKN